jgi:uncharacterized protein (TIGR00369 family)
MRKEGLVEWFGIEEEALGPGRVRCRLALTEAHQNIQGVIHGSVTMALLDTAMGHALTGLLHPGEFCGTTQFSLQYLAAVRPGERIVADGEVTRRGRRIAYLEGTCRREDGEVVARAHGTWYIGTLERQRPA